MRCEVIGPDAWRTETWANGAGTTHEILRWPEADFVARISVAEVTGPAPFSKFPRLDRWLYLIEGGPITLTFPHEARTLTAPGDHVAFSGALECAATDVPQPSRDLNFMVLGGRRARAELLVDTTREVTGGLVAVFAISGAVTVDERPLARHHLAVGPAAAIAVAADAMAAVLVVP